MLGRPYPIHQYLDHGIMARMMLPGTDRWRLQSGVAQRQRQHHGSPGGISRWRLAAAWSWWFHHIRSIFVAIQLHFAPKLDSAGLWESRLFVQEIIPRLN